MRSPLSSYTDFTLPRFLTTISRAMIVAIAPSIFSVDFSLSALIFPADKPSARKIFNNMAIDLNLPYHCPTHFFKKTFAYWFFQIHKNDMLALATLQDILNHSSEKMTLKYCGIEKEKKETMLKTLA